MMKSEMIKLKAMKSSAILGGVFLASCVTINIYFPAAAAEKAADKIIDEVWQIQPEKKPADIAPK